VKVDTTEAAAEEGEAIEAVDTGAVDIGAVVVAVEVVIEAAIEAVIEVAEVPPNKAEAQLIPFGVSHGFPNVPDDLKVVTLIGIYWTVL